MLHEKRIRSLAIRIKAGCQGFVCPLEPAAAQLCSVAPRQFGSTSEGYAVFLGPQDLAGVLSVCHQSSGLRGRGLAATCAAGCRHYTPSGHERSRRQIHGWPPLQNRDFEEVATHGFDAVISHVHWVYSAYILLHMSPPGLSPGVQRIGDKQRALQQGLADQEKRHILQKLTQIGGVQRYKAELRQALAGTRSLGSLL